MHSLRRIRNLRANGGQDNVISLSYLRPQLSLMRSRKASPLAAQRLGYLQEVELLEVTPEARRLAARFVREVAIPAKAEIDALHVAVAAVNGMTYLASWNCTHIVNAITLPRVYDVCRLSGYEPPFVCTPQELMGDFNDA